jgi:hypothetical protein
MITHIYEYTYVYPISISIFKRLSRFDVKIHKVDHQNRLAIDGDVASH